MRSTSVDVGLGPHYTWQSNASPQHKPFSTGPSTSLRIEHREPAMLDHLLFHHERCTLMRPKCPRVPLCKKAKSDVE